MIGAADGANPHAARAPLKLLASYSGYLFAAPYLALFAVFLVGPLAYGFILSFYRRELLSAAPAKFIALANYREAFGDPYFWQALGATLRFVAMAVPLTVALALVVAVGIGSAPRSRQAFYRAAYFAPSILTITVAGLLWRWFYNSEFGIFNALLARVGIAVPWLTDEHWAMRSVVIMTLWWTLGGPLVVLIAGLEGIPPQYHEAAALDGAGSLTGFWWITLPLLRPVLLFVLVMNAIGAFQVFGQTFIITSGGPERSTLVLVQYIYQTAFNSYRMGYASAMSWILFVLIAVFSVGQFRVLREAE